MAADEIHPDRFVMVGAGAAARVLGLALARAGYVPDSVLARDPDHARRLAAELDTRARPLDDPPDGAGLWCLCVSDGAVGSVAVRLGNVRDDWRGCTVLHLSGARDASPLAPLGARGAVTLAFHPVQTFTPRSDRTTLDGVSVGISGDDAGRKAGLELAERLGLRPVFVSDGDRPLYHLATALVSNGTVTLSAMAHEVLAACGIDADEAGRLLAPLVAASAFNLASGRPESVLTGPVVRGDADTVDRHVSRLSEAAPHLLPVVVALTAETVRLAMRSGRLDEEAAEQILGTISRFLV